MTKTKHIACDLDGTLAEYHGWQGIEHIGAPIPRTLRAVQAALARGWRVSIFTARVAGSGDGDYGDGDKARGFIDEWVRLHVGQALPITAVKHGYFDEFWDDKGLRLRANTGVNVLGGDLWDTLNETVE